jgi:hypothetical protein
MRGIPIEITQAKTGFSDSHPERKIFPSGIPCFREYGHVLFRGAHLRGSSDLMAMLHSLRGSRYGRAKYITKLVLMSTNI